MAPIESSMAEAKKMPIALGLHGYASAVIGEDRVTDFKAWAFGAEADEEIFYKEIPDLWNERHIELLEVKGSDRTIESFDKMLQIYDANVERRIR